MDTQKISVMKLMEAELQKRVRQTEPELTRIDMIVQLSEMRVQIEDLQQERRKSMSVGLPPDINYKAC